MDTIKHKLYRIQENLQSNNRQVSALAIKNIYLGKEEKNIMLLKIFEDHNNRVVRLIEKDFAAGTAER